MSNEEPKTQPTEPTAGESWTLDSAPRSETPVDRLARDLNETAQGMTMSLNDLQDELSPHPDEAPADVPGPKGPVEPPLPDQFDAKPTGGTTASDATPPVLPPAPAGTGAGAPPPTRTYTPEGSDDDRLMSGLAWLSMVILQLPIVSVIQLLSPVNRERNLQRHHAITSLLFFAAAIVYEIIAAIAFTLVTVVTAGCAAICLWIIFLVPHILGLYYAYQAYMGKRVELPVLSEFGRKQGWM